MATETLRIVPDPIDLEPTPPPSHASFQEATRAFQCDLLAGTLEELGWNVSAAARRLKLARSHVHNLIRQHGLERLPTRTV